MLIVFVTRAKSLFECAISMVYADSAVSAVSLEQALACKTGCPLLARSLSARFRQPRRQSSFRASYWNSSLKQALRTEKELKAAGLLQSPFCAISIVEIDPPAKKGPR